MKLMKAVLENINVLNVSLLIMAIFLFFEWDYSLIYKNVKIKIPKPKEILIKTEEKKATESTVTSLDYITVSEKNIFHPERKMPTQKKEEQIIAKPEVILYGTLITSDKRIAYIEDKKNPYSTPGRGKRQVVVKEGSMIAGYKLMAVNADSILLVRGEDKIVVALKKEKERKPGDVPGKSTLPNPVLNINSRQMPPPLRP